MVSSMHADPKVLEDHLAVKAGTPEETLVQLKVENRHGLAYFHLARVGYDIELIDDNVLQIALEFVASDVDFFDRSELVRGVRPRIAPAARATLPSSPPAGWTMLSRPFWLS